MRETAVRLLEKLARYKQDTAQLFQGLESEQLHVDETPDPELADVDVETPINETGTQTDLTMAEIDEASMRHHDDVKQFSRTDRSFERQE